jgi:hypothetical protein
LTRSDYGLDRSFPRKAGCVDGTSIVAIRSSLSPYANRYESKTRLRLAVSRFPSTGSHCAAPALISCTPASRLPIPIIFYSATALLAIALPTHLGAGARQTGEGVTTLRRCGRMWFRKDYVGLPRTLIRRKWFSRSHLDGRARDLEGAEQLVTASGMTRPSKALDQPPLSARP